MKSGSTQASRIQQYKEQNKLGRKLLTKIVERYVSKDILDKAADRLDLDRQYDQVVLESQMEQLMITDFAIHDLKFEVSDTFRTKVENRGRSVNKDRINLIDRFRLLNKFKNPLSVDILKGMSNATVSIFEVIGTEPPEIKFQDLLDETNKILVIDFNLSKTILTGMVAGFRLKTIQSLPTSSGNITLFQLSDKATLLEQWNNLRERQPNINRNYLLSYYLFHQNRKLGLPATSEIFLD